MLQANSHFTAPRRPTPRLLAQRPPCVTSFQNSFISRSAPESRLENIATSEASDRRSAEEERTVASAPASSSRTGDHPNSDYGSNNGNSKAGGSGRSSGDTDVVRTWLNQPISLPAGLRTSRRELLKLSSLAGAAGCFYVAASRSRALSLASPQALLNALLPPPAPVAPEAGARAGGAGAAPGGDRVAAFKRYIADLERRGGGREVTDFPRGADWLNSAPLRLSGPPSSRGSLAGRVVVLDFWTYCCVNCMHVLPDLAQLESQFAGAPVAVVGVHSAKFDNERDSSAIRAAVLRYDISHPVVNDARMALWGALGVSAWPTLAVVSPRGRLLAMLSGEGHRQDLEDLLTAALQYYSEAGQLDGSTPLPLDPERNKQAPSSLLSSSPLRYPGKLACDPAGGRLFISDSNNHRILVTDLSGGFIQQIGGNGPALRDGSLDSACFNRPQGLVFSAARNALFVADTENHAVRCCDLAAGTVVTLAGNGSKGGDYRGGRSGSAQPLNSPWDVELDEREENLYIALAGQHQIWRLELGQTRGSPSASSSSSSTSSGIGAAALFSGTGSERNQNGPTPLTTSWAQPSGLSRARDGSGLMYVADSESSSVRVVDLASGASGPKAGGDPLFSDNLFRFGDKDGFGAEALLQHPLAVLSSADGSAVYVADSYNHRIKVLNPNTNELVTLAGSGVAGFRDGVGTEAQFSEPAGLCLGPEGVIFVADTNNNAVRMLDPTSRRVTTLTLRDVPAPRVDPLMTVASATRGSAGDGNIANGSNSPPPPPGFQVVRSQRPLVIGGGGSSASGSLTVTVALPSGYHLTAGAGSSYYTQVVASGNNGATAANVTSVAVSPASGLLPDTAAPSVTLTVQPTTAFPALTATPRPPLLLRVLSKVYYCQLNDVCLFEQVCFEVPLQLGAAAASAAGGGGGGAAGQAAVDLRYEVLPATQPTFVLQ